VFYVERDNWMTNTWDDWLREQKRRSISLSESDALARQLTLAAAVAPTTYMDAPVKYKNHSSSRVTIVGTTEQYFPVSGVGVSEGRAISAGESAGGRPVCVIGTQVASNLFPHEQAVGNRIKIAAQSFEVIGVLEKQGTFLGMFSLDNRIIIPLEQFRANFANDPEIQIQIKAAELVQLDEAREELRQVMRRVRRVAPGQPDDFAINQQDQFVTMFHRVAGTIAVVGLLITGLSLFVGGIGIMNIMFVSVAERTREIGIRKAIGAKRRTILLQFLIEAVAICFVGGLVGIGFTFLLGVAVKAAMPSFPLVFSVSLVLVSLLVSVATGVLSGFVPALGASRLDPVVALRYE
jgi:putative ABC transport system permease protein